MAAICTIPFQASFAQFYNGHQMNFGKNRVQYSQNEWRYYRYPKFDTYYNYQQEKDIAQYTCDRALEIIPEMEKFFGRTIQRRIIFVVYSRLAEFRQSNIGLVSDESQSNLGGVTRIIGNKVMLYFDGDHNKYDTQIREAVASIVLSGSVNNGLRNRVQSSASESMPEWYSSGLSYFAAESWNAEIEDILKDGFESGKYKKINYLSGDDAKYAGYSLWYFINRTYGRDAIPGIIYLTGISKSPNLAIRQVLNVKFKQLNDDWNSYYLEKFGIEGRCKNVSESDDNDLLSHYKRNTVYDKPLLSPDGRRTFYCTNKYGKYKVYITDNETNTTTRIFTEGHKLEQITEYNYPVAVWHKLSLIHI